jgi:hypothetical protein
MAAMDKAFVCEVRCQLPKQEWTRPFYDRAIGERYAIFMAERFARRKHEVFVRFKKLF